MDNLKLTIKNNIPTYSRDIYSWNTIDEFMDLVGEKDGYKTYDKVIQAALDKYKCVKINKLSEVIHLSKPIIMKSGYHLWVDAEQEIKNVPGYGHCLLRNSNIENGFKEPVKHISPDTDISVEGGIWNSFDHTRFGSGDAENIIEGQMSSITFSNAENIVVINAILKGGSQNYGVQLSNIKHFYVSNITFIEHGADGVHINGPAGYGEVCNLKGENMGDDMVALNAWDWEAAAISFGTIEYVYVHDNESKNNELRLLPGRKMYENSYVDCDIQNCIIENLFGIYTFKMYNQPNIKNAKIKNYNDSSGTVGNIKNIYFKNININENRNDGFNGIPINGVYDICSNCEDIYFEDIKVDFDKEEFEKKNLSFISAGPLSVTWKNGSDNPDDWGEAFSPNDVCVVKNLHLKNITFKGNKITSAAELTKEIHLQINEDYPNTTPKGGTGYGTIENVTVE